MRIYGKTWKYIPLTRRGPQYPPTVEGLLARTRKGSNGCVVWIGATDTLGYGFKLVKRRVHRVHRLMYALVKGPIPKGLFVLHSCDNPPCVNIRHLRLGSQKDNMRDAILRGRKTILCGEDASRVKLTRRQVNKILTLKGKLTGVQVAREFGVHSSTIYFIWRGMSWVRKTEQRAPAKRRWATKIARRSQGVESGE